MSGSPQPPEPVYPVDVHEERNLLRNIQNALGLDGEDAEWDDNALAAIIANTARLNQVVERMGVGDVAVEIGEVNPQVSFEDEDLDIALDSEVFQEALEPLNRVQLYDVSTANASDDLLSRPIRPMMQSSSFRFTVVMDTNETLSLRSNPDGDDDPASNQLLNSGAALITDARYEFTTDVDPGAEYNFRTGAAATIAELRVQEMFTS